MRDLGMEGTNEHQLWVNLSSLGDGNIFAVLPELVQKMLAGEDLGVFDDDEPFDLVLPSDDAWQAKIYYKLVEKQRMADALEDDPLDTPKDTPRDTPRDTLGESTPPMQYQIQEPSETKLHYWNIIPKKRRTSACERPREGGPDPKQKAPKSPRPITWTVGDIAKAGRLLTIPPLQTDFEDEQEMRRVYTLIYDVFRYKNVLTQALKDIAFFVLYPKLDQNVPHVWLLLYDLYHRGFKERDTKTAALSAQLFQEAAILDVEACLWEKRIKLAASIARLRIEHCALTLSELLPNHLRDERVTNQVSTHPVTCWINTKKVKTPADLNKAIQKTLGLELVSSSSDLAPNNYKWDKHCPQIISFHASMRSELAKSRLVRDCKLVVQDRSFCLGPATFSKLVTELELTGSVIQTHVNSPRTTAYLATILSHNDKIKRLMAFSAGKRKIEYETYLSQLGMTNVKIFADRLIDVSPDSAYMEEVVAVFATPPNSYSAVTDPIDLVCSRGGDLSMLEVLTESENSKEGKERVCGILDEQRRTLRFAMSRPQIQFVLYETHSELNAENSDMVTKTVKEVNRITKVHHAAQQGKMILANATSEIISVTSELKEINNNLDPEKNKKTSAVSMESRRDSSAAKRSAASAVESEETFLGRLVVPDTDIFDTPELPSLCPNENACLNLMKEGCYLALLQRKQVIRLDNKYMIQMAENRGLFGRTSSSSTRTKGSKGSKKKQKPSSAPQKNKRRIKDTEVERIAAPTHTFLRHTKGFGEVECCTRYLNLDEERFKPALYKQWWTDTTRHITDLRSSLERQKLIPPGKKRNGNNNNNARSVVDALVYNTCRIDEIAADSRHCNMQVFPKLRLPRENHRLDKRPLIMPITSVLFEY